MAHPAVLGSARCADTIHTGRAPTPWQPLRAAVRPALAGDPAQPRCPPQTTTRLEETEASTLRTREIADEPRAQRPEPRTSIQALDPDVRSERRSPGSAESSVSPAMHNDVGQRMDLRRSLIVRPRKNQPPARGWRVIYTARSPTMRSGRRPARRRSWCTDQPDLRGASSAVLPGRGAAAGSVFACIP